MPLSKTFCKIARNFLFIKNRVVKKTWNLKNLGILKNLESDNWVKIPEKTCNLKIFDNCDNTNTL